MGVVCPIDDKPDASIAVGDIAAPNVPGRVRKFILLFHLPAMPDKKLTGAVLRLRLGHVENGTKEKPLPPASLVHAGNWPDASWDSEFHGLDASSFSDRANFAEQAYICDDFDITDEFSNAYHFFGPTMRVDYAPTLELDFD